VLWGADDRLFPLAYGEAYHKGIPGSRLVTLDRCGHLPHVEAPERFADAVLDFLKA
jgi:pimeloyl-ACP methyl ester carboxylesterase